MADAIGRFAAIAGSNRSAGGAVVTGASYSAAYGPEAGFDTYFLVDAADVRYGTQDITGTVHGLPINTVAVLFCRDSADHSRDAIFFVGGNSDAMGRLADIGPNHVAREGECEWSAYVETFAGHALTTPDGQHLARKLLSHIKRNAHPYGPESKAEIMCLDLPAVYNLWPMLAPKN